MTALRKKLLRDLWHLRGQVGAIAVVVACGVAVVVTTRSAYESLALSQSTYYASYRFADVFAQLERAPDALRARIAAIPGVAEVASLGGKNLDVHLIKGEDLLRLANQRPPFAALKLNENAAFVAKAAASVKRTGRLEPGSYVVVLEHSTRGTPPGEVRVSVRIAP